MVSLIRCKALDNVEINKMKRNNKLLFILVFIYNQYFSWFNFVTTQNE